MWKQNRSNSKYKNILNLLKAVIHKNKRNAVGNSEKRTPVIVSNDSINYIFSTKSAFAQCMD